MYRNLQISVAIIHQLLYLEKQKMYRANQFIKAFCELSYLNGVEQKQKIEEMNELMDNMTMKEFSSILKIENLDRIIELIDLNTLPMENAFLLLKNMGYWKVSTETWIYDLSVSILFKRFERMIAKEGKKKEGKNEKLLIGLCQCYILLIKDASNELIPIIVPCLLNAALKKEESDEAQKEEEITLLALGNFSRLVKIEKELYLNEIKEIIKNHQKHHNLTRLAYQSAWEFLIGRLPDNSLEDVIANELHFAREAARELEESSSCMDWKNEDAFEEKRISESKKEYHTLKWLSAIDHFFSFCELWNEELSILIGRVSRIFRVTKDNGHHFSEHAIQCLYSAIENSAVGVIDFFKNGSVDIILEEMVRLDTITKSIAFSVYFMKDICHALELKMEEKEEETKRKIMKRKIFEKMEEEGYENFIIGLFRFTVKEDLYSYVLIVNINDFFINC